MRLPAAAQGQGGRKVEGESRRCGGGWYVVPLEELAFQDSQRRRDVERERARQDAAGTVQRRKSAVDLPPEPTHTPPPKQQSSEASGHSQSQQAEGVLDGVTDHAAASKAAALRVKRGRRSLPSQRMDLEKLRMHRLRCELGVAAAIKPKDLQYKQASKDNLVRQLRGNVDVSSLSADSLSSLTAMGIDAAMLDPNKVTAVSDVTVFDIRVHSIDDPPMDVNIRSVMEV
ncbi:hypothetical protein DIPPA_16698 [Diplonema papillatum]|nr:hypothetical protein DIPPA_16698 [Diplonema papillatum]